ncbi:4Fe-4S dicluster domain-containing protein [Roseovarius spongiae]|uniref:4Fe-4S dicluster domain-containing protein n=1 Tax=Roseovarius spongiae TaxID=2320272 RepID=A0A3A8AQF5_9RHOB|nr:4Fe-4S binding protein [Roseovarius spongiae]RKF12657.1 4Fe-4S dicluster domain-containing protein [Roseovarius spongiae]
MTKPDRLLLCSCAGSMSIDAKTAQAATGAGEVRQCSALCTAELDVARQALAGDGVTLIACGQQARQFEELSDELGGSGELRTTDIRDRAGWSDGRSAHAKQAALLAEAMLDGPDIPLREIVSEGVCLILGSDAAALDAARRLAGELAVTCLMDPAPRDAPPDGAFDLAAGRVRQATGALGGFRVTVDGYAPADPAGRGAAGFAAPVDGAESACDIILDLRRDAPLFPAPEKRDGYLRADPRRPGVLERAVAAAADLRGRFEKPLHIRFDPDLCAHSRAGQPGCERCLSVCPTGAILPAGDTVAIDPDICAGCGACAAVCPSGAATRDDPPVGFLFSRLRTLASAYRAAGGGAPRALFHDEYGAELIRLAARFGDGLPPDVIPVAVPSIEGVGHAEMLAAVGSGFSSALLLCGPRDEVSTPQAELALAQAILAGAGADPERLSLIEVEDPDALPRCLREDRCDDAPACEPVLAMGGRREVVRLVARALADDDAEAHAPEIPLPDGAPYGAVVLDSDACTLCLACVSLCPSGALADNPDKPQLRFQESACLQCGICANICPEDAITLAPKLDPAPGALSHRVLHEEEPFNCIACGTPFGVRSTIERIAKSLEGKHWMFEEDSGRADLIRMCEDCRVRAQFGGEGRVLAGTPERPPARTSQDYANGLAPADHRRKGKSR